MLVFVKFVLELVVSFRVILWSDCQLVGALRQHFWVSLERSQSLYGIYGSPAIRSWRFGLLTYLGKIKITKYYGLELIKIGRPFVWKFRNLKTLWVEYSKIEKSVGRDIVS